MLANGNKASDIKSDGSGFTHLHRRDASHPLLGGKPIWGIPRRGVTLRDGMWCRERPGAAGAVASCTVTFVLPAVAPLLWLEREGAPCFALAVVQ